jgi:broad specificity phosphatase PhoE
MYQKPSIKVDGVDLVAEVEMLKRLLPQAQSEWGEDYRAMYLKVRDELAELQQREWQGLTETEKEMLWDEAVEGREHFCSQYGDFADAIEAKLKGKNT